jgi:hypothetical protein
MGPTTFVRLARRVRGRKEAVMAIIEQASTETLGLDLYRDIHKGIRAVLFDVTARAGSADPADAAAATDLVARVQNALELLEAHSEHEDDHVQPAVDRALPQLGVRIATDHRRIDGELGRLAAASEAVVDAARDSRRSALRRLYLDFAAFTGSYLEHQDFEERVVMPALEAAIGGEAVAGIHAAIIGSIPPAEMATALSVMLPAMNVDDRAELLGGMQAGAPAEVFAGVWALAATVLAPGDITPLAARLGLD